MKILILGAKGMLGQQFLNLYGPEQAEGWDREVFDFENILDARGRIEDMEPAAVINCVAYNDVDGAEQDEQAAMKINAESVGELAKICKKLDVPLVHFSTNYVFDGKKGSYDESDEPNPLSAYGRSKYQGEQLLQKNTDKFYLIRTAVLFGERGTGPATKQSFVDLVIEMSRKGEQVKAYTDIISSITYAVDLAQAVKLLLDERKPFGIYHIVNAGRASRYELAAETLRLMKIEGKLTRVTSDEFRRAAVIPKTAVLLNNKLPPLRSWQEALKEFLTSGKL